MSRRTPPRAGTSRGGAQGYSDRALATLPGMTDDSPTILDRLPADPRFVRVPATIGDGDLLLAAASGGVVAIAPPWTTLRAGEPTEAQTTWRVGWFAADEDGVDLDAGAAA